MGITKVYIELEDNVRNQSKYKMNEEEIAILCKKLMDYKRNDDIYKNDWKNFLNLY